MSRIRLSFVTNSSSSSFILAVKDEGFLNSGTGKLEKFVKGIIFGSAEVIKTKEELDEYFKDTYVYSGTNLKDFLANKNNEGEIELYNEWLQYINKGYLIIERTVDNYEETMIKLINQMPDGENIIMIREEY